MIFQNDLRPDIAHSTCYYCCIAYGNRTNWSSKELNYYFGLCKLARFIDSNCYVSSPNGIATTLGNKIQLKGKFYLDYKPEENDFIIGCWKKSPEVDEAHFMVMDNSGEWTNEHIIYDPWKGGSETAKIGLCTSLRVFKKVDV